MEKKRVLIVTQEIRPYIDETDIANITSQLPIELNKGNYEIRVLMPRFGNINERRHRLHEVVRLSGINIELNDEDYPLIIKVASLPGARLQVYFLDNDDFYYKKEVFTNNDGVFRDDNLDRMLFFCLGALETVKKFGWPPDFIHCHGWMSSLIPALLKTSYKDEPIFASTTTIYTAFRNQMVGKLNSDFNKVVQENTKMDSSLIEVFDNGSETGLNLGGLHYADAITNGSSEAEKEILEAFKNSDKPQLPFDDQAENILNTYVDFYKELNVEAES